MNQQLSPVRSIWSLKKGLVAALALRLLTLYPAILDDDEAWFSVSGYSMKTPADALRAVIDNKPPGTSWFYWFIAQLTGSSHLAQWARLIQILGLGLAVWLISGIVRRKTSKSHASTGREEVALALCLAWGATHPKLFATTNEGLMIPWIALAITLAWPSEIRRLNDPKTLTRALLSGIAMAIVIAIKPTGLFFLLPWTLAFNSYRSWILGTIALIGVTLLGGFSVGLAELWQWAYVYPASTLISARGQLLGGGGQGAINLLVFAVVLLPLSVRLYQGLSISLTHLEYRRERVTLGWFAASIAAVIAGKGIFPHYFLLILPPLCLLALKVVPSKKDWIWLGSAFTLSAGIAAIPVTGVFWGNDLPYFERVSGRIHDLVPRGGRLFIWGGSLVPLALTGKKIVTGFANTRFITPPYAAAGAKELFLNRFEEEKPELVLDFHERGDNGFNIPISGLPELQKLISKDYEPWSDPALPWVRFYRRKDIGSDFSPSKIGFCHGRPIDSLPARTMTRGHAMLMNFLARKNEVSYFKTQWFAWDGLLRASYAWDWFESSCARTAEDFTQAPLYPEAVQKNFRAHGYATPLALDIRLWWASLAVVELQPVYLPRSHEGPSEN